MKPLALEVRQLRKSWGRSLALDSATFSVESGEVFGLLGPNGAGKTTLLSILSCLTSADAGEVLIEGEPLRRDDPAHKRLIGIGTQDLAIYSDLTPVENLRFFGRLYGLRGDDLDSRVEAMLELTELKDRARQRAGTFSGGQKRRLNLGVAMVHRPKILFLDEPTSGVDPQSRNHIFERVRRLAEEGTTIVYTSHYMEEVQTLCERIAILDRGRVVACDTLAGLLSLLDGAVTFSVDGDAMGLADALRSMPGLRVDAVDGSRVALAGADVSRMLMQVLDLLRSRRQNLTDLKLTEPNLERVFLHLTERTLRD